MGIHLQEAVLFPIRLVYVDMLAPTHSDLPRGFVDRHRLEVLNLINVYRLKKFLDPSQNDKSMARDIDLATKVRLARHLFHERQNAYDDSKVFPLRGGESLKLRRGPSREYRSHKNGCDSSRYRFRRRAIRLLAPEATRYE